MIGPLESVRDPRGVVVHLGRLVLLYGIATLVFGCSATARSSSMVPESLSAGRGFDRSVAIEVTGSSGEGTDLISDEEFESALRAALAKANTFSAATDASTSDYDLQVVLLSQNNPIFGGNMRSVLDTVWILTDKGEGAVVWKKGIHTEFTASYGEAFVGATRLRIAVEGAARENIRDGILALSELELEPESP